MIKIDILEPRLLTTQSCFVIADSTQTAIDSEQASSVKFEIIADIV